MAKSTSTIRFSGTEIPCHKLWKKLETLSAANTLLDRLNTEYPALSSHPTVSTVAKVNGILSALDVRIDRSKGSDPSEDLQNYAQSLLKENDLEAVLDVLEQEKGLDTDLRGLISLIGSESYLECLAREANMLTENQISPAQIAELWNEQKRPSPDSSFWHADEVSALLDSTVSTATA